MGAICGTISYGLYVKLCSSEDMTAVFGWVFFWPQYPMSALANWLGCAGGIVTFANFTAIALYYGSGFLGFSRAPGTVIGGFLVSGSLFLMWLYWMVPDSAMSGIAGLLFWPAGLLLAPCEDIGASHGAWIFISWASISATYAVLIGSIHTFFIAIRHPNPSDSADLQKARIEDKRPSARKRDLKLISVLACCGLFVAAVALWLVQNEGIKKAAAFLTPTNVVASVQTASTLATTRNNLNTTIEELQNAANKGDSNAMQELARRYYLGVGVTQDDYGAAKWYRKAAEAGNFHGAVELGWMYQNGQGLPKDYNEAIKWYRKAADAGNSDGEVKLGWMHQNGLGMTQDYDEAVKWYRKAAEAGDSSAEECLGVMYVNGWGVAKDYQEAVKWYRKAAEAGNLNGENNLGFMYQNGMGVAQNYQEGISWTRKAADAGNIQAEVNLGITYQNGEGVARDYNEAVKWYRKAAEAGNSDGQVSLGFLYEQGRGVNQDQELAIQWYRKSAAQGNDVAQNALKRLGQ
jgi:TPR repeat protein